ncbi:MAG: hypothetical protein RI973_581 [Bacteroidota bacterium]
MLKEFQEKLQPYHARLVAVSKTQPNEQIMELYRQGQRDFGENKVQELAAKYEALPKDISWHLIGHLQTNKVKYIAPFVACIHSVDSLKLLQEIDKQAARCQRTINCLLQFHIAEETTKYGLSLPEAEELLQSAECKALKHVNITGVMGMATFTEDEDQILREFRQLAAIFRQLKNKFFADSPGFRELSMGMSGDYQIALEEGSTMVRIGTLLFGERQK